MHAAEISSSSAKDGHWKLRIISCYHDLPTPYINASACAINLLNKEAFFHRLEYISSSPLDKFLIKIRSDVNDMTIPRLFIYSLSTTYR